MAASGAAGVVPAVRHRHQRGDRPLGRLRGDGVEDRDVAAAVDATGRFEDNFTDRGVRSYLWGPLMLFGDDADRTATATRLKDLHGQVRGKGPGCLRG